MIYLGILVHVNSLSVLTDMIKPHQEGYEIRVYASESTSYSGGLEAFYKALVMNQVATFVRSTWWRSEKTAPGAR